MKEIAYSSNVISVSDFVIRIKGLLEDHIPFVAVEGEVSNLRIQSSGHVYFTLKDEISQVPVILFKGDAQRQKAVLREGESFIIEAKVDVYIPKGGYQLIARNIMPKGLGFWGQKLEALKQKLAAEGLFDKHKKRSFPLRPRKIGIITSPQTAALQDFLSVLRRKGWTGNLFLFPALVQGKDAPQSLINAIQKSQEHDLNLLVVIRGGGSIEDLWCFNDENLIRTLAKSRHPILSGVGHEIDYTLCDFVADFRAETPTAAAEWIANEYLDWIEKVSLWQYKLNQCFQTIFRKSSHRLGLQREKFMRFSPTYILGNRSIQLDELALKLKHIFRDHYIEKKQVYYQLKANILSFPFKEHIFIAEKSYEALRFQLNRNFQRLIKTTHEKLNGLMYRLHNLSLKQSLKRGFVLVSDENGKYVSDLSKLRLQENLNLKFLKGSVDVKIEKINEINGEPHNI